MLEAWRWYGPLDKITLPEIAQTGAKAIVNALHEVPYGEVWQSGAIEQRAKQIVDAGFSWAVVESLPIHEDIKRGEGNLESLFANYRQSMANLADQGISTICYNFMPLLDWTRTDLAAPVARGGTCLRFEAHRMAAFEIHMLGRTEAQETYPGGVLDQAQAWYNRSSKADQDALLHSIMSGLPGAFDRYDIAGLRMALQRYRGIDRATLRANYARFLQEIIPTAVDLGIKLCVHPDDPPRDILGLPRIVSTREDIEWVLNAEPTLENGLTLCSGSLGANPANDVTTIASQFADRIHFAHLRNVSKDPDGSFEEAAHLSGDTDMVALIQVLLTEQTRRQEQGRADALIPFRPDHGHELLGDVDQGTFPGYPMIGRLRGLAELRGVIKALSH
ncbi:mannonate dehydratase [Amylibacter marinus]|uniref:Mannonate dehydratase n=1 Tax=Amylibacter marinus TaxID=1475483 RepID=A0ABQ5VRE7_9RHOB|nr:mannonate dehydratase [Amylibacter marinus]GLQ33983.1 mannonate dehydratase [Amylibacter marinus]